MGRFAGYLKMLRIGDWIKFYPLFPVIGAYLACGLDIQLLLVFILFSCAIGYGFVVNNYFDVEIDRCHPGKARKNTNPLVNNHVSRRGTVLFMVVLIAFPLAVSALMGSMGFFFTLACIIALTLYSGEPFRLKDRFVIDILTHGLMFGGLPVLAGYTLAAGGEGPNFWFAVAVAGVASLICFESLIAHQITDYEEDVWTAKTTVVQIGPRRGGILLGATMVASILAFEAMVWLFTLDPLPHLIILGGLVAYPVYGCRWEVKSGMRTTYRRVLVACMNLQR